MSNSIISTNSYRLVVKATIDNEEQVYEFDVVERNSVTLSSDITNHPIVNGDIIADHMYRNPIQLSVNGKFSLHGNKATEYVGDYNDRLANIQDTFERIMNEGIFCTLYKLNRADDSTMRFKQRDNMILTNIVWTEHQNSVDFSFTFVEALTVDIETVTYEVDVTDPNLPALTDASTLDFTDTLLNWEEIDQLVLKILISNYLITEEFLNDALTKVVQGAVIGTSAGVVIGIAALKVIYAICGSIPVWGWIAAVAITGVLLIVGAIAGLCKAWKKRKAQKEYGIKAFEYYKNDRKNQREVERFCNFIGTVHKNLEYLEDVMQLYGIAKNENQECMVYIDDKYYIFTFMKNNTTLKYSLTVTNIDGQTIASQAELTGFVHIGECTSSNYLFRTSGGGFYVYIMNLKAMAAEEEGKSQKEIEETILNDLSTYAIFVSQTNMSQFNTLLSSLVTDAMKM